MMFSRALFAAALLPAALAFQDSHPIIAWSSHSSGTLSSASNSLRTDAFLNDLLLSDAICDNDAVILVDQIGLHASDLRSLPPSSSLVRIINEAPSSVELPYMRRSAENPFFDLASAISQRCGSRILSVSPGEVSPHIEGSENAGEKHVMCVGMPAIEGATSYRKNMMALHETMLSADLERIANAFPKHLVVYAGWNPSHDRRQYYEEDEDAELDFLDFVPVPEKSPVSSTRKAVPSNAGILKRYQLLTPGLIICLLVVLFVLFPILFMAISALASIQSSVRLDAPKGFNAVEKKNQ